MHQLSSKNLKTLISSLTPYIKPKIPKLHPTKPYTARNPTSRPKAFSYYRDLNAQNRSMRLDSAAFRALFSATAWHTVAPVAHARACRPRSPGPVLGSRCMHACTPHRHTNKHTHTHRRARTFMPEHIHTTILSIHVHMHTRIQYSQPTRQQAS